jgi:hypothetical protein
MILAWIFSNWRLVLIGTLMLGIGIQEVRIRWVKSDFQTYQLNIEKQVADNKTKAALETARMAQNASDSLQALQTRLDRVNRAYSLLRKRGGSPAVPALSSAAPDLSSCPGNDGKPDALAKSLERVEEGILGVLEEGDRELSKYVELWKLEQQNAGSKLPGVAPQ